MSEKGLSLKRLEPITIKVEINQKDLKDLVGKRKLSLFMDAFSSAIGDEIRAQTLEHLVSSAINKTSIGNISIVASLDEDHFQCGNTVVSFPVPGTMPRPRPDNITNL